MMNPSRLREILSMLLGLQAECICSMETTLKVVDVEERLRKSLSATTDNAVKAGMTSDIIYMAENEVAARALSGAFQEMLGRVKFRSYYAVPANPTGASGDVAEECRVVDISTAKNVH